MKTVNYIILIAFALFISGCVTPKKALKKVTDSYELSRAAYDDYVHKNPIVPMPPIFIKGKDSIVYVKDTTPYDPKWDDRVKKECPTLNIDSLKLAYLRVITKVIYSVDTMKLTDSESMVRVKFLNEQTLLQTEHIIQLDKQVAEQKHNLFVRLMWIIGIALVAGIAGFFLLKIIFKI